MFPIQIRRALTIFAVFGALAVFTPAHAASTTIQLPVQVTIPIKIEDPDGACLRFDPGGTVLAPTLTCVKAGGAPVSGAPVCTSLTANEATGTVSVSAGTLVTVKANCTNTDANTTYTWTGTGTTSGPGIWSHSLQVTTPTTFTVVAKNGANSSSTMSVTVNVTAVPPPVDTGAISCPGYNNTIVRNAKWISKGVEEVNVAPFRNGDIVIVRFTTPTNLANNGQGGSLGNRGLYNGLFAGTAVLSTAPCDFNTAADSTHALWKNQILGVGTMYFNSNIYLGIALQAGKEYFLNVKNEKNGSPSCTLNGGDCAITVTLVGN